MTNNNVTIPLLEGTVENPDGTEANSTFVKITSDSETDFEYARKVSREALELAAENVSELRDIAFASQDHRAYDTLGKFVKTITDSAKNLMELSEKRKFIHRNESANNNANNNKTINNNLVITPAALLQAIKNRELPATVKS